MFRPLTDHGHRAVDRRRSDTINYRGYRSRLGTHTRASSLLHRRAISAGASAKGLPSPFLSAGARRTAITSSSGVDILCGIPSTACSRVHTLPNGVRGCEASVGVRGGEGASSRGGEHERRNGNNSKNAGGKKCSTFKRLWDEAKHEKGHLAMAGVCLLVSSGMNILAPAVIAKIIDRASQRGRGVCRSGETQACFSVQSMSDRTFFLGAFGVFALGSLASWGRIYALAMASGGVAARLRTRLFAAIMRQETEFFDSNKATDMAPVLTEDVDLSSEVFAEKMASVLRSLNSSINASLALLCISPSLTLVSISTVPIMGSVSMLYSKRVKRLTHIVRGLDNKTQSFAVARMANMRTVRAFANEGLETERLEEMVQRASKLRTKAASAQGFFRGGLFALTGGALMAVFWVGGSRVGDGTMTAGNLASFVTYTSMVGLGFAGLATGNADISKGLASAERVFALLDRVPAVAMHEGITPAKRASGELELRNVWFQYQGRGEAVLRGVNLQLSRGKVLALTGASGSGKSTLASLVTRLYEPTRGSISLDGADLISLNPSWLRRQVGVVDQEPVLFDGSIADNIRYGVPSASDDDVKNAAQQANAHDFIMKFPERYATEVGDQGRQLSGGEKQRVAIARAVLKNPPVLVLDEATSALDAESERLVTEALDRLVASRTVLVIAHRQSTVRKADSVAVLQNGQIGESGGYDELMGNPDSLLAALMKGENL